ncbi:MAG: HK97-gp10 family putative phage morphogenesis protein [Ethanoligenens sp.]
MAWKGYSSYGKTALGVSIQVNGLDELLAKVEASGNDIDETCAEAVNAGAQIAMKAMKDGAARHRKGAGKYSTDEVYNAVETVPAKKSGNYIYATIGVNVEKHPRAIAAVFQEYGDGHSAEFPDPFVRPAFDDHKSEIRNAEKAVLKVHSIPVDG